MNFSVFIKFCENGGSSSCPDKKYAAFFKALFSVRVNNSRHETIISYQE